MSFQKASLWTCLWIVLISLAAQGVDLDHEGAKQRWLVQKGKAAQAENAFHHQEGIVNQAQSQYYNAAAYVKRIEQQLDSAKRDLVQTDQTIHQLEYDIPDLESKIRKARRDIQDLESSLFTLQQRVRKLEDEARSYERERDTKQNELQIEKAKPEPDTTKVAALEQQIGDLNRRIQQLRSQINRLHSQCQEEARKLQWAKQTLTSFQNQLESKEQQLLECRRIRLNLVSQISNFEYELGNAKANESKAYDWLDRERRELSRLQLNWQQESTLAQQLYDYYQQVWANYQNEKNKVIAMAHKAGSGHGTQEALDRAPAPAQSAGTLDAQKLGTQAGTADGKKRDYVRGYLQGRKEGSTSSALSNSYQQGIQKGESLAESKAKLENFPKGYNDALAEKLASTPEKQVTLDLATETPEDPGSVAAEVASDQKPVGNQPAPQYPLPSEPPYILPVGTSPSFQVPARDNRYFAPPCSGLILAEFEPLCQNQYDAGYGDGFTQAYARTYREKYQLAFSNTIQGAYDSALNQNYPESKQEGLEAGARDQGVLDGFARQLPQSQKTQYQAGRETLQMLLAQGFFLTPRSEDLYETNGDGLFTPGEKIKVRLVLDNLGLQASPKEKLRVRISEVTGLADFPVEPVLLPAIAGDTRLTLLSVATGTITEQYAGQKLRIKGVIEKVLANGSVQPIAQILDEKVTHFPLELETITLSKIPKVDEAVAAKVRYRNLTNRNSDPGKLSLRTTPKVAEITPAQDVVVPALAGGESAEVDIQIKPGLWVGDNAQVKFLSEITGAVAGIEKLTQAYGQIIPVSRNVSLLLYSTSGSEIPQGSIDVKAGSTVSFRVKVKVNANHSLPGPYILKVLNPSVPELKPANGSTISVNYGSLSPNMTMTPTTFSFQVPASLKGRKEFVAVGISEAGKYIQGMQVGLNIQ